MKSDPKNFIERFRQELPDFIRARGYECKAVDCFGAVDIHPRHMAVWVITGSDAERDRMKSDAALEGAIRKKIRLSGYPAGAVPLIGIAFESQETVDRDWGGDWYQAMK